MVITNFNTKSRGDKFLHDISLILDLPGSDLVQKLLVFGYFAERRGAGCSLLGAGCNLRGACEVSNA